MNTLLTFAGFHDPYSIGLVERDQQPGPILSLARATHFDRIHLFGTPNTQCHAHQTAQALIADCPATTVEVCDLPIQDPTDYVPILRQLRSRLRPILQQTPDHRFYVAVASGTPQIHACWVLLVASGELPARILHVRPPQYVSQDTPMVSEVDLSAPEFPEVRPLALHEECAQWHDAHVNTEAAVRELGIVGNAPHFAAAITMAATLAEHTAPVLIQGETGTGKELLARLLHRLSGRDAQRFIPVNCGSLPASLVESLLFGHGKGSFTGAVADHTGKFEQADGGTLFLDEIGEMPLEIQPKLLRVLQDGIVEPVGARWSKRVNVRVVAATHMDLHQAVEQKTFREDLYYRLSFATIRIPPLRERRTDIPLLALHVLDRLNRSVRHPRRLSTAALLRLQEHPWHGNVRDLENVLGRSILMTRKNVLGPDDLLIDPPCSSQDPLAALPDPAAGFSLERFLKNVRKQLMLRALDMAGGNQSGAARLLDISPQAVHKFLKEHA